MNRSNPTGMSTRETAPGLSWAKLLEQIEVIAWDIADRYGVDLGTVSWHWFTDRVSALLTAPVTAYAPDGTPLYPTRIQRLAFGKK